MTSADPVMLQVQWLEQSMLVHAVTVAGGPALADAHLMLLGAFGSAGGAGVAYVAGAWPVAAALGAVWVGCALGLARRGWLASRAVAAPPRRLLVELREEQVAWTLLAGDRWSMRHDHQHPLSEVVDAAPAQTPSGLVVRIRLAGGSSAEIPLHGLPAGDAEWLAERIGELLPEP